jgi:hypothetical protein
MPDQMQRGRISKSWNHRAIQLPIHNQPLDAQSKMESDTNSPAHAGLHHLTRHFSHSKYKPKVSRSNTLRNKPRGGGGTMTDNTIKTADNSKVTSISEANPKDIPYGEPK